MKKMLMTGFLAAVMMAGVAGPAGMARGADDAGPIDMNKARGLFQREQKGEKLTAEEQAYLDRAKAERAKRGQGQNHEQPGPVPEAKDSLGIAPLTDLTDKYKGEDGGLYGGGKNDPPTPQLKLAMEAVGRIKPLDKEGKPSEGGKIVLLSIGMSNTTQEFSRFKVEADADAAKNPKLVIVDGAQGGMDADAWISDPKRDKVWQTADQQIAKAGTTPQQVQIVWIKQALIQPARLGEFPKSSDVLKDDIVKILNLAKEHFPNLQVAYLSNRIYAGYAASQLNPEPYSYESAFAVRGVIQQQMKGDAALNPDASKGPVKSPVVLWGPYLWADGVKGRKIDDLVWKREDLGPDGTHPSESGREKVAQLLLKFFKTDVTAKTWFTKSP